VFSESVTSWSVLSAVDVAQIDPQSRRYRLFNQCRPPFHDRGRHRGKGRPGQAQPSPGATGNPAAGRAASATTGVTQPAREAPYQAESTIHHPEGGWNDLGMTLMASFRPGVGHGADGRTCMTRTPSGGRRASCSNSAARPFEEFAEYAKKFSLLPRGRHGGAVQSHGVTTLWLWCSMRCSMRSRLPATLDALRCPRPSSISRRRRCRARPARPVARRISGLGAGVISRQPG
jgi:hypothetical protein